MDSSTEDSVFGPEVSIICFLPIVVLRTALLCRHFHAASICTGFQGHLRVLQSAFPFLGFRVLCRVFEGLKLPSPPQMPRFPEKNIVIITI